MYKLSIEADSLKEMLQEFADTFEEMGCVVIKANDIIPDSLEGILKMQETYMVRKGESVSEELVKAILETDQVEIVSQMLSNEEQREELIQAIKDAGYSVQKENSENIS